MPRYIRRNVYKLSGTEWDAYAAALDSLKTSGGYDAMVELHQNAMNLKTDDLSDLNDPSRAVANRWKRNAAHRGPSFLPWHRRYLQHLEENLTSGMTVPYWPWEEDETLANWSAAPLWTAQYLGSTDNNNQVQDGPFAGWNPRLFNSNNATFFTDPRPLEREFNSPEGYLPSSAQVDQVLTYTPYDSDPWWTNAASDGFRNRLEGWLSFVGDPPAALSHMHNAVHVWIGGDMGPGTSPNDPVFFLHHCNVDRIWAKWQELRRHTTGLSYESAYLPQSGGPPGHNRGDVLFPWNGAVLPSSTVETMLDLTAHSFVYDDVPIVKLLSTEISFGPVIAGETSHAAASFDVISAFPVEFTLQSLTGAEASFFADPLGATLESKAVPDPVELEAKGYGWVAYTGEALPAMRNATAVIRAVLRDPFDNAILWQRDFTLPVSAESIARPSTAVSLVLDQSNSMSFASGFPSKTRLDVLHFSAPPFVELLGSANGIGIVAFDHDAYPRMPVTSMPGAESTALGHITTHTHNPAGNTSIADGITEARSQLAVPAVTTGYDDTAVVVLTDGHETAAGWLVDLPASAIGERIYAVGLGKESAIQPDKLQMVVNGASDGFLLLTGELDAGTDTFLLSKYFLKILAGVKNLEIGRDPEGSVAVGAVVRVPFELTEADIQAEAILLTEFPVIDMALETPAGEIIDQPIAAALAGVQHVEGQTMQAYRVSLPVLTPAGQSQTGTWHALLRQDPHRLKYWVFERFQELLRKEEFHVASHLKSSHGEAVQAQVKEELERIAKLGAPFSFNVILRSNLKMTAFVHQTGYDPGEDMRLRVHLTEYRQPVADRARVQARIRRPDDSHTTVQLAEVEPGIFETVVPGTMPGVWRYQILATGETLHGHDFEREDMLTGWIKDPARGEDDRRGGGKGDGDLCSIAKCLLSDPGITRWLEKQGVDVASLRKCVAYGCDGGDSKALKLETLRGVLEEAIAKFVG